MPKISSLRSFVKGIFDGKGSKPRIPTATNAVREQVPGMISTAETAFYRESATRYLGKEGAIVDLGCWLGSTSIALAQGLLHQDSSFDTNQEKVFGFDIFQWEQWMPAHTTYCQYNPGDCFLPEARRVVRDHGGGQVELIQADLRTYQWAGGPIKILLVDAMKTEDLSVQIPKSFFSSLVRGGLLIHQDFKHYHTSWIHPVQYRLRQYFKFYRSVPSGTVAFEVLAPIPTEAINRATEFVAMLDDEADAAFRYSLELVQPSDQTNIAAAHVMHYVHRGQKQKASDTVAIYRPRGILDKGEFPKVLDFLAT